MFGRWFRLRTLSSPVQNTLKPICLMASILSPAKSTSLPNVTFSVLSLTVKPRLPSPSGGAPRAVERTAAQGADRRALRVAVDQGQCAPWWTTVPASPVDVRPAPTFTAPGLATRTPPNYRKTTTDPSGPIRSTSVQIARVADSPVALLACGA
jgi:hypothetical protein